jgi:glutathione S-transferase
MPLVLEKYKGLTLPPGSSDSEEGKLWQRIQNWIAATETRRSVVATRSDEDEYFKVYERYARNTANSLVAIATRTGEALP